MKKQTFVVLSLLLMCSEMTVHAQRPSTPATKTISSTKLAENSETRANVEAFSLEAGYEMLVTPLVASIKVLGANDKGECSHSIFQGKNRSDGKVGREYLMLKTSAGRRSSSNTSDPYKELKSQVIFDFCRETDADLIVMPQFSVRNKTVTVTEEDIEGNKVSYDKAVEENGFYVVEVEMIGYPAVYTGFRDANGGFENQGKYGDEWIKDLFRQGRIGNDSGTIRSTTDISVKTSDK